MISNKFNKKLRFLPNEVRGKDPVEHSFLISLVEFLQPCGKQSEGGEDKYSPGAALLQLFRDVDHAAAGGDHIVDHDAVLSPKIRAAEIMGDDGIYAVHDPRIVSALVEHSDVDAEEGGQKYDPSRGSFVRRDEHQMIGVDADVLILREQRLGELQGR